MRTERVIAKNFLLGRALAFICGANKVQGKVLRQTSGGVYVLDKERGVKFFPFPKRKSFSIEGLF